MSEHTSRPGAEDIGRIKAQYPSRTQARPRQDRAAGPRWNRVAAIGEELRIAGFGLAGALTCPAEDATAVRQAWATLPDDVAVVILTPLASQALGDKARRWAAVFTVVLPT